MKTHRNPRFALKPLTLAVAFGLAQLPASAGAVTNWVFADKPLYLGNTVPANLLFLVDDSGSMDWDVMTKDYVHDGLFTNRQPDGSSSGTLNVVNRSGCTVNGSGQTFYGYTYAAQFTNNAYNGSCDIAADQEPHFRNSAFNPLYFDPRKEYKPWPGKDASGNAYTDIDPAHAWYNPYQKSSSSGEEIDLLTSGAGKTGSSRDVLTGGFRFYTWNDANGDTLFDAGETTEYAIGSGAAGVSIDSVAIPADWFGASAADPVKTIQTNFANWFSYYRARHLVATGAFSDVVGSVNNMYMGLATLHNHANVNTNLALIDQSSTGETNRATLLTSLQRMVAGDGTPLQNAFKQVGKYLANQTNSHLTRKTPLTAAQGGECQQNFTLVMTDGFYNGSYTDSNPKINNADGDKNSAWDAKTYPATGDSYTKTLADIAMYYYESDLDSTNANKVPIIAGVDENSAQHMVTFSISFGLNGDLTAMPSDPNATFAWPNPALTDKAKIDDLRHAAYNGRGEFLEAQDPDSLVSALTTMINAIQARTSASAGLAFNSTTVRSTTLVFQGRYLTKDWTGEIRYLPISTNGSIGASIASTAVHLESDHTPGSRAIITYDPEKGTAVPFRWADFSAGGTWRTTLGTSYVLDYLRGDHACEVDSELTTCGTTKSFRNRQVRLGDIINSSPVYVGPPNAYYEDASYITYSTVNKNRTPVVYVGSNDGMLHGFDASIDSSGKATATTGKELIAFVPRVLISQMQSLSSPGYSHQYFVDGSPTAGDAYFDGAWHSIVVGGLRAGGQEVYALDVTDPTKFTEANASSILLGEFTDADDADLGYTFSEPSIAKLANGHFGIIFGNGYNSTATVRPDGVTADTQVGSGNAVLFIKDLEDGTVYKLDTGYGPAKDPEGLSRPNGLSGTAVVDVDGDSVADYVYAGDLFGNMWRFNISKANPASWFISYGKAPMFTASSPEGDMQSITTRPSVGMHPVEAGYMVYFGTGKYFELSDYSATGRPTQSFYGIWDVRAKTGWSVSSSTLTRADLLQQEITAEVGSLRETTDNMIDWNTNRGWYLDLIVKGATDNQGERVVTESLLRNGTIMFTTMIPNSTVCDFGGTGWLMILDSSDGSHLGVSPFDVNGDGQFTAADYVNGVPPSGAKSGHGIPSAPALIEGTGGAVDLVAMNYSDGSLGGTGLSSATTIPGDDGTTNGEEDDVLFVSPPGTALDSLIKLGIQGRLNWLRLK